MFGIHPNVTTRKLPSGQERYSYPRDRDANRENDRLRPTQSRQPAVRCREALRLVDELKRRQQTGYVAATPFVDAYLGLGDNEQALAWLERAYQEQANILMLIKVNPNFDPLRGDPRFADLVHRVGLDQPR